MIALLLIVPAVGATEINERRSSQEDLGDLGERPSGLGHIQATVSAMYEGVPVPPTQPLPGASVTAKKLLVGKYHCVTKGNGKCAMQVFPGWYIVRASKEGFLDSIRLVRAKPGEHSQVSLLLIEETESTSSSQSSTVGGYASSHYLIGK